MIMLNNGRSFCGELDEVNKKVMEIRTNIINFDNVSYIINQELSYVLKYRRMKNNITKDMILCGLIGKFVKDIYIKTPDVKKIISFINCDKQLDANLWFFKNIDNGYVPTLAIIQSIFNIMTSESKFKLFELYPTKVDKIEIFNFDFLIKNIFTTSDIKEIDKNFDKFKILRTDINNIIANNGFNISLIEKNQYIVNGINSGIYTINYTYNILNYMIHYNINLDVNQILMLLSYNNFITGIFDKIPNSLTPFQKSVLDKLPNIIQKLNIENLNLIHY